MGSVMKLADDLWSGRVSTREHHPWVALQTLEEIEPRLGFVSSFANVAAVDTDDGLVMVDTGGFPFAAIVREAIRGWSPRPLHTAVYTHGHVDHVFGVPAFEEEARAAGWPMPRVVAHEALPARFDRYRSTVGLNASINARQFQVARVDWPTSYRYPDVTYRSTLAFTVGDLRFLLTHGRGETDDATWVWLPDRKVLFTGDFFIWATPNAGNPQKVQRYPLEWARVLRTMAALDADLLCPGHGFPIRGAARVRQALEESAELLESLHDQALALMNEGAPLDAVIQGVRIPAHLLERPYLEPTYDEPEFIVRNVWRFYAGWWDGDPTHLKSTPRAAVAAELAALAGGAGRLAERAGELLERGELALACHLAELAMQAAPGDAAIRSVRAAAFQRRAEHERSLMARGIYRAAADEKN
jgi:alkyl sulfatase BDS1-like metallo-beta-lactamase superfamily hydrolase